MTFLPYPDVVKTVKVLDYKRLGNQRNEALIVLKCNLGCYDRGWKAHPCVQMWKGYEDLLKFYYNSCVLEWVRRGYQNTMQLCPMKPGLVELPPWWGWEEFHASHRASLLAKNFKWYQQFGWQEEPRIEPVWPDQKVVEPQI